MVRCNVGDYVKIKGNHLPKVYYGSSYIVKVSGVRKQDSMVEVTAERLNGHQGFFRR